MRLFHLLCFIPLTLPAAELAFLPQTLASDLRGGYQVVATDLNRDGKPDLIALASGLTDLLWFENPGAAGGEWKRHILASNLTRMINCAAWDVDGDGIPELGIAYEFANEAKKSIGIVGLLQHRDDPNQTWKLSEIDRLTTSHRLRWADIDGSGKKVLVNAPLTGATAEAPAYMGHTPIVIYRPGEWKRELISEANEGVQHGIYIHKYPGDKRDSIVSASFSGIHVLRFHNGQWTRRELARGDSSPAPKSGSSDVAVGHVGKKQFLTAIEPWHGNQVSVYGNKGKREVIDTTLVDGHTIVTADFDGDGTDEIVAGFRGSGRSVNLYRKAKGGMWIKTALDSGGMAAAACTAADLDGDGKIDVACIGSATANLKIYWNQTKKN